MTLKSKLTFRKLLSVFLAILTVMSIFAINVQADFQGSDSTSAGSGTVAGNYHITTVKDDNSLIVGYRFSIVDTDGVVMKDGSKFKIIDVLRSSLPNGNSQNLYAYAAGNGTGAGADSHTSMKMKNKRNKYQWATMYKNNPSGIDITRVASNSSSDTYGITFDMPVSGKSYPNIDAWFALGYTDTVENWVSNSNNRAALLNALGYSGVTAATVDNILQRNRIIIEPLVKVEWDGICTLFSAAELAIMNYAYVQKGKSGFTNYGIYAIRRFTNGVYQQCLYVNTNEQNLNMPASAPLALVNPSDIKNLSTSAQNTTENLKTYGYILTHTIGMAIYYNKVKEAEANVSLKVQYHTNCNGISGEPQVECPVNSTYYKANSNGLITGGGKVYQQTIGVNGTDANGLVDSKTFGLNAPDGYHWNTDSDGNRTWKFFAYTKALGLTDLYRLRKSDHGAISPAKEFWKEIYYNESAKVWRYKNADDASPVGELTSTQVVDAYPDISVNKIKVVYHLNGGTGVISATEKLYTDAVLQISSAKPTRTNFEFIGWSLDEDRDAADFDKDKNADSDFTAGYYATPTGLAKAAGKENAFKTGDITVDLYAVWEGDSLTVKYAPNGGRGKVENQSVDVTKSVTLYDANRVTADVKEGEIPFTRYGYNLVGWQRKNQKVNITGATYILNDFSLGETISPAKKLREYKKLLLGTAYSSATSVTLNAVWESKNETTQINVNVTPDITVPTAFVDKWTNPLGTTDSPSIIPAVLYRDGEIIDYVSITLNGNKVTVNGSLESLEYGDYTLKIVTLTDDSYLVGTVNGKVYTGSSLEIPLKIENISSLTINLELKNYVQTINVSYKTQFNEFDNAEFVTTLTAGEGENAVTDLYSYKVDGTGKKTIIVPGIIKNAEGDSIACSYSTFMKSTPAYYTPDDSQFDTGKINGKQSNTFYASFENWYIWDFAVDASPSVVETDKGDTFNINITAKNKRPRTNTPKVTVKIMLGSEVIGTRSLTIDGNSSTDTITIPVDTKNIAIGTHNVTVSINLDNCYELGNGKLYEEMLEDNESSFEITVREKPIVPPEETGDLTIYPVATYGRYKKNHTVIVSFYIFNNGPKDILKEDNVSVDGVIEYYTPYDNTIHHDSIGTVEKVVVPSEKYVFNQNWVYFKFEMPEKIIQGEEFAVKATVKCNNSNLDNDVTNNTAVFIDKVDISWTSDVPYIGRQLTTPNGMENKNGIIELIRYGGKVTSADGTGDTAKWNEWVETPDKKLKLQSYSVTAKLNAVAKVDNRVLTAAFIDDDLVFKSGYGITVAAMPSVVTTGGVTEKMYGIFNQANLYYPEYKYHNDLNQFTTLEYLSTEDDFKTSQFTSHSAKEGYDTIDTPILGNTPRWELPQNKTSSFYDNGKGMARKHFSPLWWKDGRYTLVCDAQYMWTPIGVIAAETVVKSGKNGDTYITGSMYDDYYTARG